MLQRLFDSPFIKKWRVVIAANEKVAQKSMCEYEEALLRNPRYQNEKNLNRFEHQIFSQFGEDGMIAEIFNRIGVTSKTFLEIGVGDGLENNTTALLAANWSGFWIEGNPQSVCDIKKNLRSAFEQKRLQLKQSFVNAENVHNLLKELNVPNEVDLFSIDIDRNTYWVWKALHAFKPRMVVVEYNAQYPAAIDWKVTYEAKLPWNGSSYFGASLKAYENLGKELGYTLVGCTISGVNAFFVRNDLLGNHFEAPFTSEQHYQPLRLFLYRKRGHKPCFSDQ